MCVLNYKCLYSYLMKHFGHFNLENYIYVKKIFYGHPSEFFKNKININLRTILFQNVFK